MITEVSGIECVNDIVRKETEKFLEKNPIMGIITTDDDLMKIKQAEYKVKIDVTFESIDKREDGLTEVDMLRIKRELRDCLRKIENELNGNK